jgi:hypothetical protein
VFEVMIVLWLWFEEVYLKKVIFYNFSVKLRQNHGMR